MYYDLQPLLGYHFNLHINFHRKNEFFSQNLTTNISHEPYRHKPLTKGGPKSYRGVSGML